MIYLEKNFFKSKKKPIKHSMVFTVLCAIWSNGKV